MKKLIVILLVCLLGLTMSGCINNTPNIVVTLYPLKYLVEKIAGDRCHVTCIGNDDVVIKSHITEDWQEVIDKADLFLYAGQVEPYLQIYLSDIKNNDNLDIIDLVSTTSLYSFKRYTYVTVGEGKYIIESKYYEGSAFDNIDVYDNDPFIWLDPVAMTSMANQIREWLNNRYPEDSEYFDDNFETLQTNLALLDSQYELLKGNSIKIVTMSQSFGTWQKNYGIQVYPIVLSKYGVLPDEQQLEIIKKRIREDEVDYICYEPNMTEDMIELYNKLVDDLNLIEITISNLSSLSSQQQKEKKDYLQIMYENLAMLESTL